MDTSINVGAKPSSPIETKVSALIPRPKKQKLDGEMNKAAPVDDIYIAKINRTRGSVPKQMASLFLEGEME